MNTDNRTKPSDTIIRKTALVTLAILLYASVVFAQDRNSQGGYQAGNSYSISDIENVNLTNGNLMMNIPLGAVPGRGTAPGYSVNLRYNAKLWQAKQEWRTDGNPVPNGPGYMRELLEPINDAGWTINSTGYALNFIKRSDLEEPAQCTYGNNYEVLRNAYVYKLEMQMPDGSVVAFRPYGSGTAFTDMNNDGWFSIDQNGLRHMTTYGSIGPPEDPTVACGYETSQITTSGMNYYSSDGSNIRLFVPYGSINNHKWIMYLPDGRLVENALGSGIGQRITDRNGNKLEIKGATLNDMTGMKIENDVGQYIFISDLEDGVNKVIQPGFGGELIETRIEWDDYWVDRKYKTTAAFNALASFVYEEADFRLRPIR